MPESAKQERARYEEIIDEVFLTLDFYFRNDHLSIPTGIVKHKLEQLKAKLKAQYDETNE